MIDLVPLPDKEAMERLGRIAEEARKDMGEELWRKYNEEWKNG